MEHSIQTAYELGKASTLLRHLCLNDAAAWTLEQSVSLNTEYKSNTEEAVKRARRETRTLLDTSDQFQLGRLYLIQNEHFRASDCFEKCGSVQALFLKFYSKYLAAQKQKCQGGWVIQTDPLALIQKDLERRALTAGVDDAFIYYLYGLVSKGSQSCDALVKSVKVFSLNWNAWEALLEHVRNQADFERLVPRLPEHWTKDMFLVGAFLKLRMFQEGLNILEKLSRLFPSSEFVVASLAEYHYYLGHHELSLGIFNSLLSIKSTRRKGLDLYGHLLYICGKKAELSILARRMLEREKFTPEACCILGNHYSMKQDSKKAIEYFQRATRLDENFITAKLFTAQEYIEINENSKAIGDQLVHHSKDFKPVLETIQQVIDQDGNNYYAWSILGQAYEMTSALTLAEQAFQKACSLCPTESKLWVSRGVCYKKMKEFESALCCLQKAQKLGNKGLTLENHIKDVETKMTEITTSVEPKTVKPLALK